MKHIAVVLLTLRLLVACSEQSEVLPRADLSQLNSLEQEDLKKELLAEMSEKAKVEMKKYSDQYQQLECFSIMCFPSLPVSIQTNLRNEMMFNSERTTLDQIPALIHHYFTLNRSLSQEEVQKIILDQQMPNYRFPFYATYTRIDILEEIKNEEDKKIRAEQAENFDLVDFHDNAISDWKFKLRIMDILQRDELKEMRRKGILITNQNEYNGFSPAADSVLVGIYAIRNTASLDYFNESYLSLYLRNKALNKKETNDKLLALEFLHPLNISDQSYLNSAQIPPFPYANDFELVFSVPQVTTRVVPPQKK